MIMLRKLEKTFSRYPNIIRSGYQNGISSDVVSNRINIIEYFYCN